jgi:methionyl-tRNA formyltransferase
MKHSTFNGGLCGAYVQDTGTIRHRERLAVHPINSANQLRERLIDAAGATVAHAVTMVMAIMITTLWASCLAR